MMEDIEQESVKDKDMTLEITQELPTLPEYRIPPTGSPSDGQRILGHTETSTNILSLVTPGFAQEGSGHTSTPRTHEDDCDTSIHTEYTPLLKELRL